MDKNKAIEILLAALGSINTTRQNHELFIQALNILVGDKTPPINQVPPPPPAPYTKDK